MRLFSLRTVECRFATQSIKPSSSDKKLSSVAPHDGLTNRLVQKVNVPCHAKIILGDDKETDEEQKRRFSSWVEVMILCT